MVFLKAVGYDFVGTVLSCVKISLVVLTKTHKKTIESFSLKQDKNI